ncbi:hypothetical protein C9374_014407 [Naegleria lovaniensis]|uniref:NADAR domain-containing protein n=1 Tax=Naegleria lovaniensis TaxID=51637 RepID=A0AA88KU69_NAELO|nr:uncharacterized protein C9374_014407 [Naegleria lovaniensis]KAG2389007.1 hypothetical protein C9374_014407 [Naegleria lovaniensis]
MPSKASSSSSCNNSKISTTNSNNSKKKSYDKYGNSDKYHFFWKDKSPFSNWHTAPYTLNGHRFENTEVGMMYEKAMLFNDHEIASQILETSSPSTAKNLGRLVSNFDEQIWQQHREELVYKHLMAKFTQNEHLKKALLETGDKTLAEASPSDCIWGIGLKEEDAIETHPNNWRGLNLLGKLLTRVKEELKNSNL